LSLLKNSFFLGACLLLSCNNNRQENFSSGQKANTGSVPSFTILTTGLPPPPSYISAEKIIGNAYHVSFIPAAGCIVPQWLSDSIDHVNSDCFEKLKKIYGRDVQVEIYDRIQMEYQCMEKIDSILRIHPDLKKYDSLIGESNLYFRKGNKQYITRFVINEPAEKSGEWIPKMKLLVVTDSATKKPVRITEKDSTLKSLYDLL
jgi:hypothetical protein